MNFTKYNEAVDWLFKQAPNYQIDGQKAYKPGLGNIQKLCDFFGNPQKNSKPYTSVAPMEKALPAI